MNNGNDTVNITSLLPKNDVEFDITDVQVPLSSSDEGDCYTLDSQVI